MEANTAEQLLISMVSEASGIAAENITADSTWEELGVDSLDFALLINEIREKIGPMSEVGAASSKNVGDLFDNISTRNMG
jgi:acyl carrier protein